jgi:chain length determinant protein tyrosine kinase EpsG
MNSQVYPLPQRADAEFNLAPRSEEFNIANREAAQPIGAMLVEAGRISEADVRTILEEQQRTGLPFGEAGMALGLLDADEVRQVLAAQFGQPAVAPHSPLGPELAAVLEPESGAVEHLRALRSQLMLRWFENDERQAALAVVSPGAGEGRSWIAANLAVLFAQVGKRTILIDADLRNPAQHRIFGVAGRVGLSAMLAGRAGWEVVDEIPDVPNLSLLPAGAVPPNPQELLARPGFARLISALRSSYEVILVDTPPAQACADAATIASRSGAALMVACRDRSSLPRLTALSDELRQLRIQVVGAVLNGVPERDGRR